MVYSRIIGIGSYLPEKILTNYALEKMVDTTNEWIVERSGIKERRIIANDEKLTSTAAIAARKAIKSAGINKDDIDLIIAATITSDFITPSVACILQRNLDIKNCPAFDINAACSGFIYGLNIADLYIKSGIAKHVLLVAAEALSKIIDWQDRSTCVLFGDGAGAIVLKADNKPGVRSIHLYADGSYQQLLYAKSPLYKLNKSTHIKMQGNELFKIAVVKLSEVVHEALDYNKLNISDIDWLVPHQANLRIIKAVAKRIKLPMERVILTIQEHGNTSAASVPLALDAGIHSGKIKHGDTLVMEAFGAGLVWGSALVDY
ncbi:MAG: 3-oxoacyl-ACP synthase [Coxiella sp. DG_40]|nr:MAG: 3-oxoacyl-ACP synthase [Coxiella sp. DG_40]